MQVAACLRPAVCSIIWMTAGVCCRDDPHWTVVVDSELKIPYPPWYPEFFRLHLESTPPFDDFGGSVPS